MNRMQGGKTIIPTDVRHCAKVQTGLWDNQWREEGGGMVGKVQTGLWDNQWREEGRGGMVGKCRQVYGTTNGGKREEGGWLESADRFMGQPMEGRGKRGEW